MLYDLWHSGTVSQPFVRREKKHVVPLLRLRDVGDSKKLRLIVGFVSKSFCTLVTAMKNRAESRFFIKREKKRVPYP